MNEIDKEKRMFAYGEYKLAYRIYGDSSGFPVFVNYGLIGSIELPSSFIEKANEINIKLLILERPGYGDSDFIEMKSVVGWADIVDKFLSYLNISEFGTIGISAGAPYAYSIAYKFPNRLTGGIYILSGVPNVLDDIVYAEYPPKHKKYYERYKSSSIKEIATEMTKYLTKYKYLLFWSKKKRSVINASLANDCKGVASVIKLQVSDWGFDVYSIKKEINLWHSQNDPEVPFLPVKKMTSKMQRAKLHIQKRKSHFPSKETINELFETINKIIKNKKI